MAQCKDTESTVYSQIRSPRFLAPSLCCIRADSILYQCCDSHSLPFIGDFSILNLSQNTKLNPTYHSSYIEMDTTYQNCLSQRLYFPIEAAIILNIFGALSLGLPTKNEKMNFLLYGYGIFSLCPFPIYIFFPYPQFGTLSIDLSCLPVLLLIGPTAWRHFREKLCLFCL